MVGDSFLNGEDHSELPERKQVSDPSPIFVAGWFSKHNQQQQHSGIDFYLKINVMLQFDEIFVKKQNKNIYKNC